MTLDSLVSPFNHRERMRQHPVKQKNSIYGKKERTSDHTFAGKSEVQKLQREYRIWIILT